MTIPRARGGIGRSPLLAALLARVLDSVRGEQREYKVGGLGAELKLALRRPRSFKVIINSCRREYENVFKHSSQLDVHLMQLVYVFVKTKC